MNTEMSCSNVPTPQRLLEANIKALLIQHLIDKSRIDPKTILINEFNIDGYSRRADFVTLVDKSFHAYEIKSEVDTLRRLPDQIEKYQHFFNKVTVVCAVKHVENVLSTVSNDVAVWEVGNARIKVHQRGGLGNISHEAMLKIMTLKELRKLASASGINSDGWRRSQLEKELSSLPTGTVWESVMQELQKKYAASSKTFWDAVKGKNIIEPKDIERISPFFGQKRKLERIQESQKAFWKKWCERASRLPDDSPLA